MLIPLPLIYKYNYVMSVEVCLQSVAEQARTIWLWSKQEYVVFNSTVNYSAVNNISRCMCMFNLLAFRGTDRKCCVATFPLCLEEEKRCLLLVLATIVAR